MERIWWEKVPNALTFTSDIIKHLSNEKSIIITSFGEIPWHSFMVTTIRDMVQFKKSAKSFRNLSDVQNPGLYLLNEFCKSEKRAKYRPSKSYAKFLAESDDVVLHNIYFWIRIKTTEQLEAWINFVSEYIKERQKNKVAAVFILEWAGSVVPQAKKGMKIFSFDAYINEYDRTVFCTLAIASLREHPFIKSYLTELAANVAGNDIELCAACLVDYRDFLKDSYMSIESIVQTKSRCDGDAFAFNKSKDEVNHLVWLSQIRTVYPAIEEYREEFVQKYKQEIASQLPITSSYGEIYNDPKDVELGTLKYMSDNNMLMVKKKDYDRLKVYKEARNKLSHLVPLTLQEIEELEA